MKYRRLWWAAAICAIIGLAMWLSASPPPSGRTLARIQREGAIRIGYAIEPPYVFLKGDGEPTGSAIEVAREVATRIGATRIEWVQTHFGSLITELEAGRFDVIAAGMFITPERARRVSFSEPTLRVRAALLVQTGNPRGLHAFSDVGTASGSPIKIAVLHGSVEESRLRQAGVPEEQLVVVPDASTGKAAVENGLVDGLALSAPTLAFMARREREGRTEVARPFEADNSVGGRFIDYAADVFRRSDSDLLRAWNAHLRAFIGSPEHRRLIGDYGFGDEELPQGKTTAEILASGAP